MTTLPVEHWSHWEWNHREMTRSEISWTCIEMVIREHGFADLIVTQDTFPSRRVGALHSALHQFNTVLPNGSEDRT